MEKIVLVGPALALSVSSVSHSIDKALAAGMLCWAYALVLCLLSVRPMAAKQTSNLIDVYMRGCYGV